MGDTLSSSYFTHQRQHFHLYLKLEVVGCITELRFYLISNLKFIYLINLIIILMSMNSIAVNSDLNFSVCSFLCVIKNIKICHTQDIKINMC